MDSCQTCGTTLATGLEIDADNYRYSASHKWRKKNADKNTPSGMKRTKALPRASVLWDAQYLPKYFRYCSMTCSSWHNKAIVVHAYTPLTPTVLPQEQHLPCYQLAWWLYLWISALAIPALYWHLWVTLVTLRIKFSHQDSWIWKGY